MQKKTLLLLTTLLLLSGLAYWLITNNRRTTLEAESNFGISDGDAIGKIFIADRSGETVTLTRNSDGKGWTLNEKYVARKQTLETLLTTLEKLKVRFVVPQAAMENVVRELATRGIKVMLYDRNDRMIKAFYVGGASSDGQGTYMIMEGADQPYVTHIPLWEGTLTTRFPVRERDWRDRTIFAENFENIVRVSVEYPRQQNFSFVLEKSGKTYNIKPFYPTTPVISSPLSQGLAQKYVTGFRSLIAEAFETDNPNRASVVANEIPFCNLAITRADGSTRSVVLYPINETATAVGYLPNSQSTVEQYFVLLREGDQEDFMLGQQRVLKDILWGYSFFFDTK